MKKSNDGERMASIFLNVSRTLKKNLTEEEKAHLELMANLYPDGSLRAVYLLDNHEPYADGSGIKGAVYVFDPKARVRSVAPLSKRMFGYAVSSKLDIEGGDSLFNETDAKKAVFQALPGVVPVVSPAPYVLSQQNPANPLDSTEWKEALGEHGSFIQLSKETYRGVSATYHLVVNSQPDEISKGLVEMIAQRDGKITFEELIDSPEYARTRIATQRNVRRILSKAADVLKAKIVVMNDEYARVNDAAFDAPPTIAIPDVETPYNYLESRYVDGKRAVVYYSHATGLSDNHNAVIQMINPSVGVRLYLSDPESDQNSGGPFTNSAANSFPIGVGRADATLTRQHKKSLETVANVRRFADDTFSWYGREAKALPTANDRTYAYLDLTVEAADNLAKNFGANYGFVELQPVAVLMPHARK